MSVYDKFANANDLAEQRQNYQLNQAKVGQIPNQRKMADLQIQGAEQQNRMNQLKEAKTKIDMVGQLLGSAVDQPSYDAARQKAMSLGLDVSSEPTVFDPNYIRQSSLALLDVKDKIELELKQAESALNQDLTRAKIGTEQAQAGSFGALANSRNAAAERLRQPLSPAGAPAMPQGKAPSGYRFKADGSLEPIPGGPGESISAELAARLGLADDALKQLPAFIEKAKSGALTGPVDFAAGKMGYGDAGTQYREVAAAAEALTRMLTGAGMNIAEAQREASLYLPTFKDTPSSVANKAEQLKRRLESVRAVAMKGRGGVTPPPMKGTIDTTPTTPRSEMLPPPDLKGLSDDDLLKAIGL